MFNKAIFINENMPNNIKLPKKAKIWPNTKQTLKNLQSGKMLPKSGHTDRHVH